MKKRNDFYGGEYSSHNLNSFIDLLDKYKHEKVRSKLSNSQESNAKQTTENIIKNESKTMEKQSFLEIEMNDENFLADDSINLFDIDYAWTSASSRNERESLIKQSRRFNIDLCPNFFYSRGKFIELLISSDVSKYSEFKLVDRILAQSKQNKSHLERMPTSRSEVFKTTQMSMIEKRLMMKFVQECTNAASFDELIEKEKANAISFGQFIRRRKMPESIANYLINCVAMCPNEEQTALQVKLLFI